MYASSFNAPSLWTRQADHLNDRRILLFPPNITFCELIREPTQDIHVIKRIGSESSEGEVFEIEYQNHLAALKLLPINTENDKDKNKREIKIAKWASDMVVNRKWDHFPMVYGYGQCDNVYFFDPKRHQQAERYSCFTKLKSLLPVERQRQLSIMFKAGYSIDEIGKRFNVNPENCQNLPIQTDFLISELAREDFSTWATRYHNTEEWITLIPQILETIRFMQNEMSLCHNDLHWGNILIKDVNNTNMALIHDFGKSETLNDDNSNNDLVKFLSSWDSLVYTIPKPIIKWFRDSENYIRDVNVNKSISHTIEYLIDSLTS